MKIIMGRVMSSPRRDQRAGASRRDDIFLAPYAAKILAPSGRHRFSIPGAIYAIPTGLRDSINATVLEICFPSRGTPIRESRHMAGARNGLGTPNELSQGDVAIEAM